MIAFLYIFTVAQAAALLFVVVRVDRLTRAAKHHEHTWMDRGIDRVVDRICTKCGLVTTEATKVEP